MNSNAFPVRLISYCDPHTSTDRERDVGGPRNAKNAAACHAYTRDQLLACKQTNAHHNPSVISRLKELSIGYRLPRHRSCRGGTRKRRQIPVVVSQRRSQDNTLFLPDCVPCTTPTPPSSPDVSLCSTARPSRANLQNLIKVPLQSSDLPNQLCVCLFNAKSVGVARKRTAIADFLADHDVDVMVLTETWLKESSDESKIADLTHPGYKLFSFPRQLTASIKGGGGIAVIMKDCLASHTSINTTLSFTHTSFEVAELLLTVQRQRLWLICVYRPPPRSKNKLTHTMLFYELPDFLDYSITYKSLISTRHYVSGGCNSGALPRGIVQSRTICER
ncbi:hypothetical protein ACOMHN_054190 [Nucella lapillus]